MSGHPSRISKEGHIRTIIGAGENGLTNFAEHIQRIAPIAARVTAQVMEAVRLATILGSVELNVGKTDRFR